MHIGVFDSGYGGLTILDKIRQVLPEYDYIYLGDNARAPYGTHSFEVIYQYTSQAVRYLLANDCALVILACNTASAKALRTIQQQDLPSLRGGNEVPNVLGVIRPTVESVVPATRNGHIGILATPGTISSDSYRIELLHLNPNLLISQQACPMWVPLIESGEHTNEGADYFVDKYLSALFAQDPLIDTVVLGCTHYPLLKPKIDSWLQNRYAAAAPTSSAPKVVVQGDIVAHSLKDYLSRHTSIRQALSSGGTCRYLTTESAQKFNASASLFLAETVSAERINF
ncbi:MAG: glutamate racemase [Paludibacteraceae bacterium]